MAGKVWVIAGSGGSGPSRASAPRRSPSSDSLSAPASGGAAAATVARPLAPARWMDVLTAYLLGPVSSAVWIRGKSRYVWNAVGALSAVTVLVFLLRGDAVSSWLSSGSAGVAPWLLVVPGALLVLFTVWSRCIGAAARRAPEAAARWRSPVAVGLLGLLVPGLGHLVLGRAGRAARAFWLLGPLIAAGVILANWQWLWFRNLIADSPALSGPALEGILVAAGITVPLVLTLWVSAALDGARRTVPARARGGSDVSGAALLAAVLLFAVGFRPAPAAQCLDAAASRLQGSGFTLTPLALAELAARMDPGEPRYLARAVELDEALGRDAAAIEKREVLERRTRAHLEVVWSEGYGVRTEPVRARGSAGGTRSPSGSAPETAAAD